MATLVSEIQKRTSSRRAPRTAGAVASSDTAAGDGIQLSPETEAMMARKLAREPTESGGDGLR